MEKVAPSEPLFRANKRRKVFRKRDNSEEREPALDAPIDSAGIRIGQDDADGEENESSGVVRKAVGVRKRGIAFTSGDAVRSGEDENEERQLVVAEQGETPVAIQGDRFVKPTGRVVVTENKHMVAYIDSKLAEMRSATGTPLNQTNRQDSSDVKEELRDAVGQDQQQNTTSPMPKVAAATTFDSAQARSTRVYQRPTKRKQPPARGQTDVARDSIIDQIMQESQVPLYDRSGSHTPAQDGDNDAATAQAFKAQLLVEMEEQNRRRPAPRNPATASATGSSMQSGPKLGGSRSQREKMRALEEAKLKSVGTGAGTSKK